MKLAAQLMCSGSPRWSRYATTVRFFPAIFLLKASSERFSPRANHLRCAVAITPFNHPLNQVAHKVAPAIAAGTPLILKPSEKTPLTALKFAELLYAAGLPGAMLSVLLGPTAEVAEPLVKHPEVDVVAFTGSVAIGKRIAATAGYKKLVLELGGNDPFDRARGRRSRSRRDARH
jgi:acyl-CoA reductase-like NAD-dependent aldehyde dehydrogenase